MLPVALVCESLDLQVASAFCLTNKNEIEAGVYFNCFYPDMLLRDLPTGWYLTDYIGIDGGALCSCLSYEAQYIDNEGLEKYVEVVINDLLEYLNIRDKDGLRALILLSDN